MADFQAGTVTSPIVLVKQAPRLVLDARLGYPAPFPRIFAKVLPIPERSIEAVCSWLGREAGLPLPEPCWALLPRSRLPKGHAWPFGDAAEEYVFATIAVEFAQPLVRQEGSLVERLLGNWPHLAMAAAFDQLIANDDRTEGNILLDPRERLWLIDHARSLGGAGNRLFSSDVTPLVRNFFLQRIACLPVAERGRFRKDLVVGCLHLRAAVSRIPYDRFQIPDHISNQIEIFLQTRAEKLQDMVLAAIGMPELYTSGQDLRGH